MQLWGGIECTVNRVRDTWFQQMESSGHLQRLEDLDRITALGIRTLRYPILWETTAPDCDREPDWRWADARMGRLHDLGITPIVGLVHHGSGPRHTSLVEDSFAPGLADFAGRVAARYPWVEQFTPINEPLTTARFSGLYGLWYPHGRSDACFARAFINQCRATVLAMQAIRRVSPRAQLVQTEDLGSTHGTAHMQYQREFDNERRWLTWDVLCGRVQRNHPLYAFLTGCGIGAAELDRFVEAPCPPDTIGINHYVTSDRYLDERIAQYPAANIGGNGRERYADVEAVRVLGGDYDGFRVIREAWERYGIPVAVTEAHLGSTREEQLRWLLQAWHDACEASRAGCDVRAVTSWALFGTFNWDTLLTGQGGYEPGAFDVRGAVPRPTAVARQILELTAGQDSSMPAATGAGWWQRPGKVLYGDLQDFASRAATQAASQVAWRQRASEGPPLLICGAAGSLGRALAHACVERGLKCRTLDRSQLDICDREAVGRLLAQYEPWALINAAGFIGVDDAESRRVECRRANTIGATILMEAARDRDVPFVTFSSDLVFDGVERCAYLETSQTAPLNEYGRSKVAAEIAVLEYRKTLCIRTAAFFGCWERGDFVWDAMCALMAGRHFSTVADVIISPTYVPDLAGACLDLLIDQEHGLLHLANAGSVSWADLAMQAAAALNIDSRGLRPQPLEAMQWAAARPRFSTLGSERTAVMPSLESAMTRYAAVAAEFLRNRVPRKDGTFGP